MVVAFTIACATVPTIFSPTDGNSTTSIDEDTQAATAADDANADLELFYPTDAAAAPGGVADTADLLMIAFGIISFFMTYHLEA